MILCVCERERQTDRQRQRQRDKQRETERVIIMINVRTIKNNETIHTVIKMFSTCSVDVVELQKQ